MCGDLVSRKGVSQSRVTFAVTGYVPDKALQKLESSRTGKIYVRVERGSDEVVMRVDHAGPLTDLIRVPLLRFVSARTGREVTRE